MWLDDNLGLVTGSVFAMGITEHFLRRRRYRRRYAALRAAFEEAVRQVQATDCDPAAIVRCAEVEREFMRASWFGWFWGFGRRVRTMLKLCAVLTLFAFVVNGVLRQDEARRSARARAAVSRQQRALNSPRPIHAERNTERR
jgi:hypothetical protein